MTSFLDSARFQGRATRPFPPLVLSKGLPDDVDAALSDDDVDKP